MPARGAVPIFMPRCELVQLAGSSPNSREGKLHQQVATGSGVEAGRASRMNETRSAPGHHVAAPITATIRSTASFRANAMSAVLAAAVLALFALSVMRSYSLGHHERMYDNPVYRWRESLAIALSRMQQPPLHGYLAYRSIRNYLAEHGLALVEGEAKAVSTREERKVLVNDTARMNQLLLDASRAPIDATLPPVTLTGNELGLADFFYWSFRIFGLNLNSLVLFYFSILFVSVLTFFLTFRRSPFCLLLLMLYLIAHLFAVHYANFDLIQTIHNSRFLSILALLPSMHIFLLLLRREPAHPANVAGALVQTLILFFIVSCRTQALWQVLAILASAALTVRFRELWRAVRRRDLWPGAVRLVTRDAWPALVVAAGLIGLFVYSARVPDQNFYGPESKRHLFWHPLYVGMISTDRELLARYAYDSEPYTDSIGYFAAMHDVRGRNEVIPGFAELNDGVITINVLKNSGAFDAIMRRIFFQVVADHPWAALRSFLIGKPIDQLQAFTLVPELRDPSIYIQSLALALGASVLAVLAGAGFPSTIRWRTVANALVIIIICSSITTLTVPSALIVDVVALYLILVLLAATYLPVAWLWRGRAARTEESRAHAQAAAPGTVLRP